MTGMKERKSKMEKDEKGKEYTMKRQCRSTKIGTTEQIFLDIQQKEKKK